jgi:hypothetical protein
MIVAKLTISYDRGTAINKKDDLLATLKKGDVTADGGVVRGLGSHFRSQADMLASQARDKEAYRIYHAFRERFMTTTIDGLYIVPQYGMAAEFIKSLLPLASLDVRVAEFELTSSNGLDVAELSAWGSKIKRQLGSVALGRKKQADDVGIKAINALADCPLLSVKTRDAIKNMTALLGSAQIDRAEFRKRLEGLNVEIEKLDAKHEKNVAKLDGAANFADDHVEAVRVPESQGA